MMQAKRVINQDNMQPEACKGEHEALMNQAEQKKRIGELLSSASVARFIRIFVLLPETCKGEHEAMMNRADQKKRTGELLLKY